jgi:ABC-type sugar transport system ATPase subunit
MSNALLELQHISKTFFGVKAVDDVSLTVGHGHVLGLIGQNGAGKSTLMNIIGGVVQPDEGGQMLLDGQVYAPRKPADATTAGIAFIHQELNLFTNLTIAENIFLDKFPGANGFISRGKLRSRTTELLKSIDLDLSPDTLIDDLSPGERQLIEIVKALHIDARLIIFDEPTTSLTARETERLFRIIQRLREAGKTIIYISHILNDVLALSDSIAVMRDGKLVESGAKDAFTINRMISMMIGRDLEQLYPPRETQPSGEVVLQVHGLSMPGIVKDINLRLYGGEVLGIFGLMGSGRTELARILFGLDEFESGEIVMDGKVQRRAGSARRSIRNRLAFVTENRREEGLMMEATIANNIGLVSLPNYAGSPLRVIDQDRLVDATRNVASALQIKSGAIETQAAKSLSGGNQQKVVISKWLLSNPKVFILDEPTRGVDVGAKYEIYAIVNGLASSGNSILFISSELDELIGMCDRIVVMSRGEIYGEFPRPFDKENILRAAFREGANGQSS